MTPSVPSMQYHKKQLEKNSQIRQNPQLLTVELILYWGRMEQSKNVDIDSP